jgi:hypothetical protein
MALATGYVHDGENHAFHGGEYRSQDKDTWTAEAGYIYVCMG